LRSSRELDTSYLRVVGGPKKQRRITVTFIEQAPGSSAIPPFSRNS
jgi:hypothetical protein